MMGSEVSLEFGQKKFRADIVVYDRTLRPLAVVECKRPEVELTQEVVLQALRYNAVLDVAYVFVTNGKNTYLYGRKGDKDPQSKAFDDMIDDIKFVHPKDMQDGRIKTN